MKILKEGLPFIIISLVIGIALIFAAIMPLLVDPMPFIMLVLGIISLIFADFCIYFFRDPDIQINIDDKAVLSPCNGKVMEIEECETENIVRVFLSIFDVHLQRSPISGLVTGIEHRKGKFYAAWNPKAQSENEQNIIKIDGSSDSGHSVIVRQIAGFLARRCVVRVKEGDRITQGEMIGLIKFSSQVDLHLDKNIKIKVKPQDRVAAGLTVIGEMTMIGEIK
ncbi:MAG: phosphatidylserine decarboxylase family protein [Termitinemataceae bacterium]|nr:MAG: phosphatidylserine decarboxylase family protein [Termitinemataceae bacterium]